MNYSKIDLELIDNSGNPFYRPPSDTLYSDAVSIKLNLSDSILNYYASNPFKAAGLFSFESVHATSPVVSYQAVHLIQDIRVFTVFDIDDTYRAGDDITDSILYAVDYGFGMYIMKEDAIKYANSVQPEPACSFMIFLKSSVKNTKAQFSVEVTLDDDSKLIGTTDVYPVIPSKL